jgi:hypothetical protein
LGGEYAGGEDYGREQRKALIVPVHS